VRCPPPCSCHSFIELIEAGAATLANRIPTVRSEQLFRCRTFNR
jgi:hypothetical protein